MLVKAGAETQPGLDMPSQFDYHYREQPSKIELQTPINEDKKLIVERIQLKSYLTNEY